MTDPTVRQPVGVRRVVPKHPAEQLDAFAALAESRLSESLLTTAERAANAILDAQGTMAVWEVRVALGKIGLLENQGQETLDALGLLGRRMGLVAAGHERPPAWVRALLPASHLNVNTRWRRPQTVDERAVRIERETGPCAATAADVP